MKEQEIIRQLQEGTGYTFVKLIDEGRYYVKPYKGAYVGKLYATVTIDEEKDFGNILVKVLSELDQDLVVSVSCSDNFYAHYDLLGRFKEIIGIAKELEAW